MKTNNFYLIIRATLAAIVLICGQSAAAFCGFYVAKADTDLFNEASKVVLARDEDKTVLTMVNDFEGNVKDFAMVVPVPTVLQEGQIHIGNNAVIEHLDAFTAPRLVEYFDPNPCALHPSYVLHDDGTITSYAYAEITDRTAKSLGVTIEAEYQIGEYDILILSAKQSDGLLTWLRQNDYKISESAEQTLGSYIKQGLKFFIARVNLDAYDNSGQKFLRPIQLAYESKRFMLPIRLGMENARGDQELFVFALTRNGRVETTNYRTKKMPTDLDVPSFVKGEFDEFYKAMFAEQARKENGKVVFTEHAWSMNSCDPCVAEALSRDEQIQLGAFWINPPNAIKTLSGEVRLDQPMTLTGKPGTYKLAEPSGDKWLGFNHYSPTKKVFVTRLHVKYNKQTFPEDLLFQTTADNRNYQSRFIIRHEWEPTDNDQQKCEASENYINNTLPKRYHQQATNLAKLTGWSKKDIESKMYVRLYKQETENTGAWWENIWKD